MFNDSNNEEFKFTSKNWYVIDSQIAKDKYNQSNSIKLETESIKSSLNDYSDTFILVAGYITVNAGNDTNFGIKNCAPFSTCKTEINFYWWSKSYSHNNANGIIIQKLQEVYGSLKEMKLLLIIMICLLIILNKLKIKQLLQKKHQIMLIQVYF